MKLRKGYLVKRGRTFYAEWTVNGKKFRRSTGKTTVKEATPKLAEFMEPFLVQDTVKTLENVKTAIERSKGQLVTLNDQQNPPLAISKAWDAYLSSLNRPDTGETTLAQYAFQFARFEKWIADTYPTVTTLQNVTPDIAAAFSASLLKDGKSANTVNKYLNLLTLVFRVLKKPARLTINPWEDIQRKRIVSHGRRELTVAELRNVCEKAEGEMRLLLAIGIYTGLRLGDAATLRWGEVDVARGIILRIPNKTGRRNPKPVQIPIHPSLQAMLAEIPASKRGVYVLPQTAEDYRVRSDTITDRVQRHFGKCNIITHKPGTGIELKKNAEGKITKVETGKRAVIEVGFHSLRHTFVSLCRAANAPLSVVESIVGHSSPAMTRHYTHTGEAAAIAAVTALPSLMGEEAPKALPAAPAPRLIDADAVLAIIKGATAKNWKAKMEEVRMLAR